MKRLFLITALVLSAYLHLFADAGPKPSMKFRFIYKTSQPVRVLDGWQLQSESGSFHEYDTVKKQGPQGFHVQQTEALSVAGHFKDYQKIIIQFDDRLRESAVFANKSYHSEYSVTVLDDKMIVEDVTGFFSDSTSWKMFIKALILTILIEVLIALLFFRIWKIPFRFLWVIILINLISLPLVWFLFPVFLKEWSVPAGELTAFLVEALLIRLLCSKYLSTGKSFLLSFVMNLVSFVTGGLILIILTAF